MFTGIISNTGRVTAMDHKGQDIRLSIETGELDLDDVQLGDSIAVNGVCLTVVQISDTGFSADVSPETLSCTSLGGLGINSLVNLEKALRLSDRLGGHLVSGHVDGAGELLEATTEGRYQALRFRAPQELARYIAAKGSICIDGVSLTVNQVEDDTFTVMIIPHTAEKTLISDYRVGTRVNLEVDLIARYLERLNQFDAGEKNAASGISADLLRSAGFTHEET